MTRQDRLNLVEDIKRTFAQKEAVILVDIAALKVSEMNAFRAEVRKVGGRVKVYKRRLALRALNELGYRHGEERMDGTTGFCLPGEDLIGCARAVTKFRSRKADFKIKGAISSGQVLDGPQVVEWSRLPGMQVLRARVVGQLAAPVHGLACVFSSILSGLVRVVDARRQQLENGSESS